MGLVKVKNDQSYGLYVWMMDNGKPFGDSNGNVMNIPGRLYDLDAMSQITKAAQYYGAPSGRPKFMAGVTRASEMQYTEELDRMREGLIPSETDIGAWQDAQRGYEAAKARGEDYDA